MIDTKRGSLPAANLDIHEASSQGKACLIYAKVLRCAWVIAVMAIVRESGRHT
jgi:hypothetical protein